jgi:hypothetical protein
VPSTGGISPAMAAGRAESSPGETQQGRASAMGTSCSANPTQEQRGPRCSAEGEAPALGRSGAAEESRGVADLGVQEGSPDLGPSAEQEDQGMELGRHGEGRMA